jgi:ATP-dependent DNA helicase 2 subunit 1
MVSKGMIAICRFVPRKGIAARLAALVPQEEIQDELGSQISPPGFVMIQLPFKDDVRDIAPPDMTNANKELHHGAIETAKELLGKLTMQDAFDPENYENPALQKHYAYLQAMALDEDQPEDVEDMTLPDPDMIEKRAGSYIDKLIELIVINEPSEEQVEKKPKKAKATKTEANDDIVHRIREAMGDEAALGKFTVPQLKEFIASTGAKPVQKKAELVAQVMDMIK